MYILKATKHKEINLNFPRVYSLFLIWP